VEIYKLMCNYRAVLACVLLLLSTVGTTIAGAQTLSRLGPSITAISGGVRGSNIAYDFKNSVYLVVSAHGNLNGRFITADGALIGSPFPIQSGDPALGGGWTHFPGVSYSPDANGGAGGFLVTWHQSLATGGAAVHARMVSPSGVLGPEIGLTPGCHPITGPPCRISADGSWWEAAADIAYSTTSKEFLVVWQGIGIRAQRIGTNGQVLGLNFPVTDGTYHRDPAVVYNPTNNEFMVTFGGADAISAFAAFRRVAAGSGTLLGTKTLLNRAGAVYISEVAYNSSTNRYLAAWYQGGTFGRLIDASGTLVSDVIPLSSTVTAYDALGVDFNTSSGTFVMVSHSSSSFQDGAVELSGTAATPGVPILATSALPANTGNFYPKIAARAGKPEWLLSTATGFAATTVQRLQSSATGGAPPPPPPPPPPPCTATPTVTNVSISNGPTTFPIDVTAESTCSWTATSAVAWLQITWGASATGPASFAVTATNNWSLTARTGKLSVGGQTVTVLQGGFSAAAVHDINGDGGSDLVWHHQTTGQVATWYLKGTSVVGTQMIDSPGVSDTTWKVVGSGDLNGDGYSDLVWQKTDGYVAAWFLRGRTILKTAMLNYPYVGPNWKIRAVGDVDGDGKSDIIWQHDDGSLAVWLMNGFNATSTLMLSVPRMTDPNWLIAGAGDINGDGRADIIWQNQANGALAGWLMTGARVGAQQNFSVNGVGDLNWKVRGVGDVNGDGRADLLWQNVSTGGMVVWYVNQFSVIFQGFLSIDHVDDLNWQLAGPG
jgi:hypothetical protein